MKHTFALTTRQAARLGAVEPHVLYQSLVRSGNWRGVIPRRLPNGRLLWRGDEVAEAAGVIPDYADQTPGERALVAFLEHAGFPLTIEYWNLGRALLNCHLDPGNDPGYVVYDAQFLVEIIAAYCTRLNQALPGMRESDRGRAFAALGVIASQVESFEGATK